MINGIFFLKLYPERPERGGPCWLLMVTLGVHMKEVLPYLVHFDRRAHSRPGTAACPACWSMGAKAFKKCTVRNRLEQPRLIKNLLYRHDKPKEPTKEGSLSFVLFEFPFSSVSTVSRDQRDHPSLESLALPVQ